MNHPIEMIASHLKQVRETLGLSVEEVCKALDISSEQYLNYEQAREDIPIGLLTSCLLYTSWYLPDCPAAVKAAWHSIRFMPKDKGGM